MGWVVLFLGEVQEDWISFRILGQALSNRI